MIQVRIPKKNEEAFNLFANGNILDYEDLGTKGTLFSFSGIVVLQYKYSHHRRVYIVTATDKSKELKKMYLPNVKEPVSLIYFICGGRRIDLLRQGLFTLEKLGTKDIYTLPVSFWQKLSCLLDDSTSHTTKLIKSNLILLHDKYKQCGVKND